MMARQLWTLVATAAIGMAGVSAATAQGYSYSQPPARYPAPAEYHDADALPNFDALDEDAPPLQGQQQVAAPSPGPVMSPDDPRYGRPMEARPIYSSNQGPVMSPDDPRYGRPMAPPQVIYADRPQGAPGQAPDAIRPPEAVGGPGVITGAIPPQGGQPATIAALPPEEQPDTKPTELPANFRRQEVSFVTKEPAGTIIVDTGHTYLYYVLGNNRAIRYGIRVGRDGFRWSGVQKVTRKMEWPDWHPPTEMIERQPYLPRFMAGGEGNPLGARAMYLGNTVYRIHGTNQPSTIGKTVSSGCFGMLNEDVMDLYDRVKVGTRVVVLPGNPASSTPVASTQSPTQVSAAAQAAPGQPLAPMSPQASAPPQQASASVPGTTPTVVPPLPAPVTIR